MQPPTRARAHPGLYSTTFGGSFPTGGRGRTRLGVAGPDVVISVCAMIVVFGSIRLWLEERRSQVLDRQTFKGRGFLRVIYIGVAYLMEQVV